MQYKIIRLLAAPQDNLFIVGDDDQSIYRFRGARPEIMLGFERDYPSARRILLDVNYRSDANIISIAGKLIAHNEARFKKNIRAFHEALHEVNFLYCSDISEQNHAMIEKLLLHH